jgi:ABC-type dipeptide/oligopeptide/nickel transport system permease subunit
VEKIHFSKVWDFLNWSHSARLGFGALGLLLIAALVPSFSEDVLNPYAMTEFLSLPPLWISGGHDFLLGTDDLGRDLLSRLVHGARISLGVGVAVVAVSASVGTLLGLISGVYGGWIDKIILRIVDMILSFPSILLAIVVVSILGPGLRNAIIAVSIVSIPKFTRVVRSCVLVEMKKQYVTAAESFGSSRLRIMFFEVLPNCLSPLIVQATLGFSDGILDTAALGFLGLGARAPLPEWGTMLADARPYFESCPWLVSLPGICILISVLSFNLLGDALRDALDPRLKR